MTEIPEGTERCVHCGGLGWVPYVDEHGGYGRDGCVHCGASGVVAS